MEIRPVGLQHEPKKDRPNLFKIQDLNVKTMVKGSIARANDAMLEIIGISAEDLEEFEYKDGIKMLKHKDDKFIQILNIQRYVSDVLLQYVMDKYAMEKSTSDINAQISAMLLWQHYRCTINNQYLVFGFEDEETRKSFEPTCEELLTKILKDLDGYEEKLFKITNS